MNKKTIVFLTGTRADFGKLKSLIKICDKDDFFDVHVFITGMHMNSKYGNTYKEIQKLNFKNTYMYINHDEINHMDKTLAKTIEGFSQYIHELSPDMIIVHGDRLEALAGAVVGAFNNILVSHIEGGEVSGTIDESIRHSITKLSHIHFVANDTAKKRLIKMGEEEESIYTIGSPDLDIILNNSENIDNVKAHYDITFDNYGISLFHPVTTEFNKIKEQSEEYFKALLDSKKQYIIIYPNNDYGSDIILNTIQNICTTSNFRIFPSIRFESFSLLLQNADFIIGNSSAGIREAPYYPTKSINVGTRQNSRISNYPSIKNCDCKYTDILKTIKLVETLEIDSCPSFSFGQGNSDIQFLSILKTPSTWGKNLQKKFMD